jgi:glyoxylase-like metal-dependent hydrolase (beta-lactamase superfamily II)
MRTTYFNAFRRLEPGLMGIGTFPAFAFGQRALILRTPAGNIMWDCLSFLDDTTITILKALGGLAGIAISHPHFLASAVDWSHTFNSAPIYLHARDRHYVTRPDSVIVFWEEDAMALTEGVSVIRCGGHFPGSSVLHWAGGAAGRGVLLAGDTLQVRSDKGLSFMHSYSNMLPLGAGAVRGIANALAEVPFDTIYGGWWERVIPSNARTVLAESADRYIAAVTDTTETF